MLNLTQVAFIQRLYEENVYRGTQIVFHGTHFIRVTSELTLNFYSAGEDYCIEPLTTRNTKPDKIELIS